MPWYTPPLLDLAIFKLILYSAVTKTLSAKGLILYHTKENQILTCMTSKIHASTYWNGNCMMSSGWLFYLKILRQTLKK